MLNEVRRKPEKPRMKKVGRHWICTGLNAGAAAYSPWEAYKDWEVLVRRNKGPGTVRKLTPLERAQLRK